MSVIINPLVSIIVPVYNAQNSLEYCVQSILNQSYKNIEIILVDDGSTDLSSSLCDKFASQHNIIRVIHKMNNGVSSARNYGLNIANGEFILFVDSDDSISSNYVESFISESINADLVIGSIEDIYINCDGEIYKSKIRKHTTISKGVLSEEYYNLLDWLGGPWAKLYRKCIIDKYQLKFDETVGIAEDQLFNFNYYRYIKTYCISTQSVYEYFHRDQVNTLSRLIDNESFNDDIYKMNVEYGFLIKYQVKYPNRIYIHHLVDLINKYSFDHDTGSFLLFCRRISTLANLNMLSIKDISVLKKKIIVILLIFRLYWLVALYYRFKSSY